MLKPFDGRWILITGAAGDMGTAFANAFAAEGGSLLLTDVSASGLERTAEAVRARGAMCVTHVADVSVDSDILKLASELSARCPQRDVNINNAGLAYGEISREFESLSQNQWLHYFAVNTVAMQFPCAASGRESLDTQAPRQRLHSV